MSVMFNQLYVINYLDGVLLHFITLSVTLLGDMQMSIKSYNKLGMPGFFARSCNYRQTCVQYDRLYHSIKCIEINQVSYKPVNTLYQNTRGAIYCYDFETYKLITNWLFCIKKCYKKLFFYLPASKSINFLRRDLKQNSQ